MAPLGSFYDPSFAAGAREGLRIVAPTVIGLDPRQHGVLAGVLDRHLNGHPYAKSALDMAAKAVLEVLPPGTVVYADANAGWTQADARLFVRATRHLDDVLEQPCADHDANLAVRAACDRPFVLDESIDSLVAMLRAHRAGLIDGVTLKIARIGGVTRTRLSLSTPEAVRTHTVDFHHWVTAANAVTDIVCADGTMTAPTGPGLGVAVDVDALGDPLFVIAANR